MTTGDKVVIVGLVSIYAGDVCGFCGWPANLIVADQETITQVYSACDDCVGGSRLYAVYELTERVRQVEETLPELELEVKEYS